MGLSTPRRANTVEGAVIQIIEVNCLAGAAVNDLVRVSTSTPNFVDVATGFVDPRPVIGVIREKVSPTVAKVAVSGVIDDVDSTSPGILYLSNTGRLTSSDPGTGGYLQRLGYSFGNGKLDFKPEKTTIFRP